MARMSPGASTALTRSRAFLPLPLPAAGLTRKYITRWRSLGQPEALGYLAQGDIQGVQDLVHFLWLDD